MNKVVLMGRLTQDPQMRTTPSGLSVVRFSVAMDRRFAGKDGQRQTDFITCVAWRNLAEFICKYFHKGRMIAVTGTLQSQNWEDKDGKKNYTYEVLVEEAYFTGEKSTAVQKQKMQTNPSENRDNFGFEEDFDISEDDLPY